MQVPLHPLTTLVLTGCLVAALSCATLPPVPGAGGPRWLQLEAEHSVLLTDEAEPAAQSTSARIELHYAALCRVAFRCDDQPRQKLRVIALHDAGHFEQLYGADEQGVFTAELVYEPQLVLATGMSQGGSAQLSRTLTGLLALQMIGPLPAWLASGLASYFETARVDAGGAFVVGDPVRRHVALLANERRLPAEALLLHPPSAAPDPVFAASAWLLVHYLQSERLADFAAFLDALGSGHTLSAAFHEAFPDLAPEILEAHVQRYQRAGHYLTQSKQVTLQPPAALVSPLSDADVYSLRAEIAAAGGASERSAAQLGEALKLDPKHVRANILRAGERPADGLLSAHPESWQAWVHSAYTEPERACAPELRDHLQAIAPDNAHTLSIAARCALKSGKKDQALSLSKRAFSAYPISPRIASAHALILYEADACTELATLQDARQGSPDAPKLGACPRHKAP